MRGGAGGDSGTTTLEVREREAHITATVRSAMCVCDAVSVERLAAHDLARSCTIPHDTNDTNDTTRSRTISHDLARSTKNPLQIRGPKKCQEAQSGNILWWMLLHFVYLGDAPHTYTLRPSTHALLRVYTLKATETRWLPSGCRCGCSTFRAGPSSRGRTAWSRWPGKAHSSPGLCGIAR